MNNFNTVLRGDERVALELRTLYGSRGYSQFKMSKFEEYDLYVRNKDFLISDSVITFTNPDGKLMEYVYYIKRDALLTDLIQKLT